MTRLTSEQSQLTEFLSENHERKKYFFPQYSLLKVLRGQQCEAGSGCYDGFAGTTIARGTGTAASFLCGIRKLDLLSKVKM